MVVTFVSSATNASAFQCLVVRQSSQDTEDNWDSGVERDAHESVRDAFADVLEVHGRTLDEDADGNDSVNRLAGHVDDCRGG